MNIENVRGIANEILAKMKVIDPHRTQSRAILKALRNEFGIEVVKDPVFRKYITKMDEKSNKYHYFVVFKKDDKYYAANAHGRIGYKPKVFDLGEHDDKASAMAAVNKKLRDKLRKYKETKLPNV